MSTQQLTAEQPTQKQRSRALQLCIVFSVFALGLFWLVMAVVLGRFIWDVYGPGGWRDEVHTLASLKATHRALRDFEQGKLRLYTIDGESDDYQFTGRTNGVFRIWRVQYYPSLGRAHHYSQTHFVEYYNRKMKYMAAHPEKFRRNDAPGKTNVTAANSLPSTSTN